MPCIRDYRLSVTNLTQVDGDGTLPITKRISGAGNTRYTCRVVVAKGTILQL